MICNGHDLRDAMRKDLAPGDVYTVCFRCLKTHTSSGEVDQRCWEDRACNPYEFSKFGEPLPAIPKREPLTREAVQAFSRQVWRIWKKNRGPSPLQPAYHAVGCALNYLSAAMASDEEPRDG